MEPKRPERPEPSFGHRETNALPPWVYIPIFIAVVILVLAVLAGGLH